ncbi:Phenylserine dehydratase [Brevibacterium casei]|uniref:Phenylserine dehydratase n=1 Tax=Brevibacterium casei TaxID=33889 RepID=A0A269ZHT2_9MICO|nr:MULTISPECIES: serine/threonine dehydratase [Brevibacterium]MCM1013148.1 serine/threonine dehydratase [Brevibacterium sp. XM4083]PAK97344.1 threonine dehydratase [Brevibacterium casei]QPS34606.1 serine/threonine dehydratase [Brevibacterium casei]VEW10896.1 Phenylserine dehydratase [Brevibacterium casei]
MPEPTRTRLDYPDIEAAAERITGRVRAVSVAAAQHGRRPEAETDTGATWVALPTTDPAAAGLYFALEFMQYTGTFKARGAQNFIRAHLDEGSFPAAGVTIASGGNAGLACAWAAQAAGVRATVFVPETAPAVKVDRLRSYGADVRLVGSEYAEAAAACAEFADSSGALASHAYDNPLIAAGAGTVFTEILAQVPDLDTVVVSVGGGGLFAGVATAATFHGVRTVAVEPQGSRAFNAALEAGAPVDVTVDSVAADSLGARRATPLALAAAQTDLVTSVLVSDADISAARRHLWAEHRLVVEHAAATALAGVHSSGGYTPEPGEKVAVVLCGANTDLGDLT